MAQEVPQTQCVCIGDSEADIYEWFCEPRGERPVHWLVRACYDRALQRSEQDATSKHLCETVQSTPVLFAKEISMRGREAKVLCEKRN